MSTTATRPRRCAASIVRGEAPGEAPEGELWVHEVIGAEVRDRSGAAHRARRCGAGEPGSRPVGARHRRAGSDGVRRRARAGCRRGRSPRRTAWICSDANRRLHDLSRVPRRNRSRFRSSAAPARSGLLDVRLHDPREHATGVHRPVDDAPFGGGAGMVMMPEPLFAAVEAVRSTAAAALVVGGWCALRSGTGARARGSRRFLLAVRPVRRRRPARRRSLLRRRVVGRRLRARGRRGGRARRDRGGHPARAGSDGQRRLGHRGVVRRGVAGRVSAVHAAGELPRLGGARRCCARATTLASPAGGGPNRCGARSSGVPI